LVSFILGSTVFLLATPVEFEYKLVIFRVEKWPDPTAQIKPFVAFGEMPSPLFFLSLLGYCPTRLRWKWPLIVLGYFQKPISKSKGVFYG
jgi:hypothetical protein